MFNSFSQKINSPTYFENLNIVVGLSRLARAIANDKLNSDIEDSNSPYCPVCNSCGETGCCSPTMCVVVKCHYGNDNLKDYTLLNLQWQFMYDTLSTLLGAETVALMMEAIEGK